MPHLLTQALEEAAQAPAQGGILVEEAGSRTVNAHPKLSPIYDKWAAAPDEETDGRQGDLLGTAAPLWVDDADWIEERIERRPWIAPGYLMRGRRDGLSGPGSAGKSSLIVGWTIALALGRRWHRFSPGTPARAFNYNTEDDRAEQQRRMSATRQFDASPATWPAR